MESAIRQVSTHLVRQHRRLRRRLPELGTFAEVVADGPPPKAEGAARRALRFLEQEVLAQADVEDAVVASGLGRGRLPTGRLCRLQPEHDSLRIGTDRLRALVESPRDERLDVAGLLGGLGRLLRSHLDDEWQSLLPTLADLDEERAAPLVELTAAGSAESGSPLDRLYLPCGLDRVEDRLAGSGSSQVGPRVGSAAQAAARRAAIALGVPGGELLTVHVDVVPVVTSPRVTLLVGRLRSPEIETVVAPVEFEVTLIQDGPDSTALEIRHDLVPTRRLPPGVPAHDVTAAAVSALAGELALIGIDRPRTAASPKDRR